MDNFESLRKKPAGGKGKFWLALVLIAVLAVFVWFLSTRFAGKEPAGQLNDNELKAMLESATAKGPSTLTPEELRALEESATAKGQPTLTPEELNRLLESASAR